MNIEADYSTNEILWLPPHGAGYQLLPLIQKVGCCLQVTALQKSYSTQAEQ